MKKATILLALLGILACEPVPQQTVTQGDTTPARPVTPPSCHKEAQNGALGGAAIGYLLGGGIGHAVIGGLIGSQVNQSHNCR